MKSGDINRRLGEFIEFKGLSYNEFGRRIGTSSAQISSMITKKSNFGVHLLEKILSEFPELNADWLIYGHGKMIKKSKGNDRAENVHLNVHPNVHLNEIKSNEMYANEPVEAYAQESPVAFNQRIAMPAVVTVNESGRPTIVQIDARAAAGLPQNIDNQQYYAQLPAFSLPWPEYRTGQHICLQAEGDSMHPTIHHHDWLIATYVDDVQSIREGYIHIIVTRSGVVVKRVLNRIEERGALVLQSDNESYPSYEEPVANVLALYRVRLRITGNMPRANEDLLHRIQRLEKKVDALESGPAGRSE